MSLLPSWGRSPRSTLSRTLHTVPRLLPAIVQALDLCSLRICSFGFLVAPTSPRFSLDPGNHCFVVVVVVFSISAFDIVVLESTDY